MAKKKENVFHIINMVIFTLSVIIKMTKEKENLLNILKMVKFIINVIMKMAMFDNMKNSKFLYKCYYNNDKKNEIKSV